MDFLSPEDILTPVSIILAMIIYILGYRERTNSEKRQNTINLLTRIYEAGPVYEGHIKLVDWIAIGRVVEDDQLSQEDLRAISPLLEFYDFLSTASFEGAVDKEIILTHRGAAMRSTYQVLRPYIEHRRERLKRPLLYKPFQRFVEEIVKDKDL